MWIKRTIEPFLIAAALKRPAVIVTGCRQTGKTALLKKVFSKAQYVSLDLPLVAEEAETSGQGFLEKHSSPVIIDEIQYAPGLFRYVKQKIDSDRKKMGVFFLTGSQKFSLMQGVSDSLAGRVGVFDLHTLSLRELEDFSKKKVEKRQLLEWMFSGGYPEIYAENLDPVSFYSSYLSTYLERDVRQIIQVRDLRSFDRFIRLAAIRSGQLLSLNSMASDVGVSTNTIKAWISVLEASNIIVLLEPYYKNLGKRLVKTPKLYFLDTGLACYLAGFRSPKDLAASTLLGPIFETLVLGQIIRWSSNQMKQPQVYFYRDHFGHEIDFVIPVGEKLKLFECKWSEHPSLENPGFSEIKKLIGESHILSKTIIIPARGFTKVRETIVEDCVDLKSLEI